MLRMDGITLIAQSGDLHTYARRRFRAWLE